MSDLTSTAIAGRIEDLYAAPLEDLASRAHHQPPGMLSALLGMHEALAIAERSIAYQRDRLAQLARPEQDIGAHEVSRVLDCARRLAEAVAVRDVQATAARAVLHSLGRVTAQPSPGPTPPVPAPPPAPAPSAAPSR
ncbi:hypothetical protein ABZ820_05060 [Streptomyces diacarni]|uniref:hypothetical protein n=1 Tax=Streptomyces diacarni TaxID=2800381 RepID=UPI0033C11EDA